MLDSYVEMKPNLLTAMPINTWGYNGRMDKMNRGAKNKQTNKNKNKTKQSINEWLKTKCQEIRLNFCMERDHRTVSLVCHYKTYVFLLYAIL